LTRSNQPIIVGVLSFCLVATPILSDPTRFSQHVNRAQDKQGLPHPAELCHTTGRPQEQG
jgi:hypothetical protein